MLQVLGRGVSAAALGVSGFERRPDLAAAESASTPTAASDLIYLSAIGLQTLFAAKQTSPVEILEVQIALIEARNTKVNCSSSHQRGVLPPLRIAMV
jgi:hypothetical protein